MNNAGSGEPKGILDVDIGDLEKMLDVHLKGPFNITQRALPAIIKSRGELIKFFRTSNAFGFLISRQRVSKLAVIHRCFHYDTYT